MKNAGAQIEKPSSVYHFQISILQLIKLTSNFFYLYCLSFSWQGAFYIWHGKSVTNRVNLRLRRAIFILLHGAGDYKIQGRFCHFVNRFHCKHSLLHSTPTVLQSATSLF